MRVVEMIEKKIKECIEKGGDCPEKGVHYCIFHNWYCPYQVKDVVQRVSYCKLKRWKDASV